MYIGVYHGTVVINTKQSTSSINAEATLCDAQLLPYDIQTNLHSPFPLSLTVTPYHILVLRDTNHLLVIDRIQGTIIQNEYLNTNCHNITTTTTSTSNIIDTDNNNIYNNISIDLSHMNITGHRSDNMKGAIIIYIYIYM